MVPAMPSSTAALLCARVLPVVRTLGAIAATAAGAVLPAGEAGPYRLGGHRQLFLDDHLIEQRQFLERRVQPVVKHPANPLIGRGSEFEGLGVTFPSVLYDAEEGIFKAWVDGMGRGVYYLTSRDGIRWERPPLGLFPRFDAEPNHRVVLSGYEFAIKDAPPDRVEYLRSRELGWTYFCNLGGVVKDRRDPDPMRRYKMTFLWLDRNYVAPGSTKAGKMTGLGVAFSPDGIHWSPVNAPVSRAVYDSPLHTTYDEARRRWVLFARVFGISTPEKRAKYAAHENFKYNAGRAVVRLESEDFIHWSPERGDLVMASDEHDSPLSEIYSLRGIPYEGIQIGLVHFFHNEPGDVRLYFQLGVSRDGRTWQRLSDRSPFLPLGGLGAWDRSTHMPGSSDPLLVGDEIWIYYSGRNIIHPTRWQLEDDARELADLPPHRGAIGLATLKRDRFVALEASLRPGTVRTKPFVVEGQTLHVNAAMPFGALSVSLIDSDGRVRQTVSVPAQDSVDIPVGGLSALAELAGQPVRLEFSLQNGRLFSFWLK